MPASQTRLATTLHFAVGPHEIGIFVGGLLRLHHARRAATSRFVDPIRTERHCLDGGTPVVSGGYACSRDVDGRDPRAGATPARYGHDPAAVRDHDRDPPACDRGGR